MTTTVTVEVDEDELTAAAALLGTSSREETFGSWWLMLPHGLPMSPVSAPRLPSVRLPTRQRAGERT